LRGDHFDGREIGLRAFALARNPSRFGLLG
jgi:hypothetical protein